MYASPSIVILFDFIDQNSIQPKHRSAKCKILLGLVIHVHHYGKVQEVNDLESSGKTWTTWIIAGNRTDIINVDDPENHFTWTDRFLITKFTVNKITNSKSTLTLEKSENLQQT